MSAIAAVAAADPVGFIEARTADRVLGWAWHPDEPARRADIVLLKDGAVVSRAIADQPRDDLLRNGIGDGAHSFLLPVPDSLRTAGATLTVAVLGPSGALVPLGAPAANDAAPKALAQLAANQRSLLRMVRGSLNEGGLGPRLDAIDAAQRRLDERIGTLEVSVVRLDEAAARLAAAASPAPTPRVPLLLALVALIAAAASLAMALAPVL